MALNSATYYKKEFRVARQVTINLKTVLALWRPHPHSIEKEAIPRTQYPLLSP